LLPHAVAPYSKSKFIFMKQIVNTLLSHSNKTLNLERNQFLNSAGSTDRNIYFVEQGSLRLFIAEEEEEQTIRFGYKNNLVVALDSFLSGKPSAFYIQALKCTEVKVITKSQFDAFIALDKNKAWWTATLEHLALQQMEREFDLLTRSPKERYERVLARSPQLFQEIPHRYIANYLRMTPETLSRLKKS